MATRRHKILNELKRAALERNLVFNGFCTSSLNAISPNAGGHAARYPMRREYIKDSLTVSRS